MPPYKWLAPPPTPIDTAVTWPTVEAEVGFELPDDFKAFRESYGNGKICDFLWLLNPSDAARDEYRLIRRARAILDALREFRGEKQGAIGGVPFKIFPEADGLFPWAETDNGDAVYWRMSGPDPNHWPVVVSDSRASVWEEFPGGLSSFLEAILWKQFKSDVFPDDAFEEVFFGPAGVR